jgi:streptogramin lyase
VTFAESCTFILTSVLYFGLLVLASIARVKKILFGVALAAAVFLPRVAQSAPATGYWWNPAESGRGFFIEIQGSTLLFAGFLYDASGRATWVASTGQMLTPTQYIGNLVTDAGGQTLTGAYQSPAQATSSTDSIAIDFTSDYAATLTWPGGTISIERFEFVTGGVYDGQVATNPQNGWWWNPGEGGRGFAIEVQVDVMYLAGYMYDASGNPIWYLASGKMQKTNLFQGEWVQFGNGQTLTGTYQPATTVKGNVGSVTVQFPTTTTATLTLPNEQIPLTRFNFGVPAQQYTVTEFDGLPLLSTREIVTGTDGNLWYAGIANTATLGVVTPLVARITPAGVITAFSAGISSDAAMGGIAAGPDGNIWFTEAAGANSIGRITPAGVVTQFNSFNSSVTPQEITAGPDGNLWFTEIGAIGRITPSGEVTKFNGFSTSNPTPAKITAGPDGNVWFADYFGNAIGRVTPDGVITEFTAGISPNSCPNGITKGPDGNLWFTEACGLNIGRITPAGVVTEFLAVVVPYAGARYALGGQNITADAQGNLWFTQGGNIVTRMTPAGAFTQFSNGISANASVYGIAIGPDGNIWYTDEEYGRIGRIVLH